MFHSDHPTEKVSPTPSPEDGNRFSFQNIVLFRILDDDEAQQPSNPEC
jgi:hypothetical protein